MELFWIIIAILCAVTGIAGSVLPVLPGPPVSYLALLIMHFSGAAHYSTNFLIVSALLVIAVTIIDYFLPPFIIRQFGGSKYASRGSLIGMIAGLFLTPIGMILGSLIGAFIGEYVFAQQRGQEALRAAFGSFLGFIVGTGMKLILTGYILYRVIQPLFT